VAGLPAPMLCRPGLLPLGRGYAYEVKWDSVRAVVSTEDGPCVRSRRGWDTPRLGLRLQKPRPRQHLEDEDLTLNGRQEEGREDHDHRRDELPIWANRTSIVISRHFLPLDSDLRDVDFREEDALSKFPFFLISKHQSAESGT
jgi:hypothetical protein